MEPWLIVAIVLLSLAGLGLVLFFVGLLLKKKHEKNIQELVAEEEKQNELVPVFEKLPSLTKEEEGRLVEIKDKEIVERITEVVPGALRATTNFATNSALNSVSETGLFRVIIPNGAQLDKSKALSGAMRGTYRVNGKIAGQANLVEVGTGKIKAASALSVANGVMSVASLVVGQYFMSQIDGKLKALSRGLDKISSFQKIEFKSKVCALLAEVQKISTFQVETMDNQELRNRELSHLRSLEHECVELLGQANLSLQELSEKDGLDFKAYEKATEDSENWYQLQQVLIGIIKEISDLTYTLNMGAISKENSNALCIPYMRQSENTLLKLKGWHDGNVQRLGIKLEENKVKRSGVKGFFMKPLGFFNDELNYKDMPKGTAERIEHQTGIASKDESEQADLYKEDVTLIAKDGKYYYLPKK